MTHKIDKTLINSLSVLARKEKKGKEFSRRVRVKGKVIDKGLTKNNNVKLVVKKGEDKYSFVVIKTHKANYALAGKLTKGSLVSIEGINKFRTIICTKLKQINQVDESKQTILQNI
jgi:hypothetical protein